MWIYAIFPDSKHIEIYGFSKELIYKSESDIFLPKLLDSTHEKSINLALTTFCLPKIGTHKKRSKLAKKHLRSA